MALGFQRQFSADLTSQSRLQQPRVLHIHIIKRDKNESISRGSGSQRSVGIQSFHGRKRKQDERA